MENRKDKKKKEERHHLLVIEGYFSLEPSKLKDSTCLKVPRPARRQATAEQSIVLPSDFSSVHFASYRFF